MLKQDKQVARNQMFPSFSPSESDGYPPWPFKITGCPQSPDPGRSVRRRRHLPPVIKMEDFDPYKMGSFVKVDCYMCMYIYIYVHLLCKIQYIYIQYRMYIYIDTQYHVYSIVNVHIYNKMFIYTIVQHTITHILYNI